MPMLSHNIITFFVYLGFHPIDGFFRTNKFMFDQGFLSHIQTEPYKAKPP